MATNAMDRSSSHYVLLLAVFVVLTVALVAIQTAFVIRMVQATCRNTCSFLTISAVGLTMLFSLTIELFNDISISEYRVDLNKSFSVLFNNNNISLEFSSEYVRRCADFRIFSIFISVINLVVLLNQAILNNFSKNIQVVVRCVTFSYFAIVTSTVIWMYRKSKGDLIETSTSGTMSTCSARTYILPVLMETLFIYGPALTALLLILNSHKRRLNAKMKRTVFKDCWSVAGGHCSVCFGSNGRLRDACIFYAIIMLINRPAMYVYASTFNGYVSDIFACSCNLLISIVLSVNVIPFLNRMLDNSTHAADSDVKVELNIVQI